MDITARAHCINLMFEPTKTRAIGRMPAVEKLYRTDPSTSIRSLPYSSVSPTPYDFDELPVAKSCAYLKGGMSCHALRSSLVGERRF